MATIQRQNRDNSIPREKCETNKKERLDELIADGGEETRFDPWRELANDNQLTPGYETRVLWQGLAYCAMRVLQSTVHVPSNIDEHALGRMEPEVKDLSSYAAKHLTPLTALRIIEFTRNPNPKTSPSLREDQQPSIPQQLNVAKTIFVWTAFRKELTTFLLALQPLEYHNQCLPMVDAPPKDSCRDVNKVFLISYMHADKAARWTDAIVDTIAKLAAWLKQLDSDEYSRKPLLHLENQQTMGVILAAGMKVAEKQELPALKRNITIIINELKKLSDLEWFPCQKITFLAICIKYDKSTVNEDSVEVLVGMVADLLDRETYVYGMDPIAQYAVHELNQSAGLDEYSSVYPYVKLILDHFKATHKYMLEIATGLESNRKTQFFMSQILSGLSTQICYHWADKDATELNEVVGQFYTVLILIESYRIDHEIAVTKYTTTLVPEVQFNTSTKEGIENTIRKAAQEYYGENELMSLSWHWAMSLFSGNPRKNFRVDLENYIKFRKNFLEPTFNLGYVFVPDLGVHTGADRESDICISITNYSEYIDKDFKGRLPTLTQWKKKVLIE